MFQQLISTAPANVAQLRRNDFIVWFLVILVVGAALFCMWKGGNVVAQVAGPKGLFYVACNLR